MKYSILILLFLPQFIFSQVGVGTTSPQETLHINGTVRVDNTTPTAATALMGMDANGTLNEVTLGTNLSLTAGVLDATGGGGTSYLISTQNFTTTSPGDQFDDVDMQIDGLNSDKVVFRLTGARHNYQFTGISGGTDGRHIILVNTTTNNFRLNEEDTGSIASNRIITLAGGFESTSGVGIVELVYDAILARWIIINFRS